MYKGEKIPANKEESIRYLKMAIDLGNSDAMCEYAKILLIDKDLANKEKSIKYFQMAIDSGLLFHCMNMPKFVTME